MGTTNLYQVPGTPYQLEELPTGSGLYVIWDTRLEAAMDEWENLDEEEWFSTPQPLSPVMCVGVTFDEARDWIKQSLNIEDPDYDSMFASLVQVMQRASRR